MRVVIVLVVGFAAGLATGWALLPSDTSERRSRIAPANQEEPVRRSAPAKEPEEGGDAGEAHATPPGLGKAIKLRYEERANRPMPPAFRDILIRRLKQASKRSFEAEIEWALAYERAREEYGEVDPAGITMQTRNSETSLRPRSERDRSKGPLDLDARTRDRQWYVKGVGVVPLDKVLVIEKATIEGRFAYATWRTSGRLEFDLGRRVSWSKLGGRFRAVLLGRTLVRPGDERRVRLATRYGAASIRLDGRLVTRAEAERLERTPFRWTDEGSTGFLSGTRVITVQIVADHGGGNPRRASINGTHNNRFDAISPSAVWSDTQPLGELRKSLVHFDGVGMVPPGKVFILRRVEYRARLNPEKGRRSDFVIRVGRKKIVETNAKINPQPRGVWDGEIRVAGGKEGEVSLELSYFGIGEARFFGEIADR